MKLTIEDKFAHVTAWRNSDLFQRQYCELHKINIHTFKSWVQLLKKTVTESATALSAELTSVEHQVATTSNPTPHGIIPVKVVHPVSVDDEGLENPTNHSSQLQPKLKQPNLLYQSDLLTASEIKPPPPEISLILTSGLQIKCDVRLLSEVLQAVEHV